MGSGLILPYPHPGQQIVRSQAKRFNWLAAGRRWRKTTMVMAIAVEAAIAGERIIWGAPVYDQVRVGWNETKHACPSDVVNFNASRMIAEFPNGGQIIYRSLDNPDNVRGHTADGVVVDEAADVSAAAWYEVLRPMLIDTNGWAWLIGTFKGLNYFANEHARSLDLEDSMAWQAPTLGVRIENKGLIRDPHPLENPNIPFDEIVNLYETQPEATFRQEILSEVIRHEGAVFRNVEANLTAGPTTPEEHKGHRIVIGIDWAQKHDFTVISIGCATCNQELMLDRFNKIEWAFQRARVKTAIERWGVKDGYVELNSIGSPNFEALRNEGMPVRGFETTQGSKAEIIQSLALALERQEFAFLPDPVGKHELLAYESKVSANGRISYSAPEGGHDDTVIGRALMHKAAADKGAVQIVPMRFR